MAMTRPLRRNAHPGFVALCCARDGFVSLGQEKRIQLSGRVIARRHASTRQDPRATDAGLPSDFLREQRLSTILNIALAGPYFVAISCRHDLGAGPAALRADPRCRGLRSALLRFGFPANRVTNSDSSWFSCALGKVRPRLRHPLNGLSPISLRPLTGILFVVNRDLVGSSPPHKPLAEPAHTDPRPSSLRLPP